VGAWHVGWFGVLGRACFRGIIGVVGDFGVLAVICEGPLTTHARVWGMLRGGVGS
jgi:hypothetical protein